MLDIKPSSTLHAVIGAFDGVHFAHRRLIKKAVQNAADSGGSSMIFSFTPLPKEYLSSGGFAGQLMPDRIRRAALEGFGADNLIIKDFESVKDYSEKDFMELLLQYADKIILYSGADFRMGRLGGEPYTGDKLERVIMDEIIINGDDCRSSNIRALLLDGEIKRANTLLANEYTIYSHTQAGDKIGRSIEFPTVNLSCTKQTTPKNGVYFGELIIFSEVHPAAVYVGERPTVQGKSKRIEAHVVYDFPYNEIQEGTEAQIRFLEYISEEKNFESLAELKKMLYNYKTVSLALAAERYK